MMCAGTALVVDAARLAGYWPALLTVTLAAAMAVREVLRRRAAARARRAPVAPPDRLKEMSRILAMEVAQRRRSEVMLVDARARLGEAQSQMIHHLRSAGALRDNETASHTDRVGQMARHLALLAGCDTEFASQLALAAPLHDVGKIGIPDAILLKPGPLAPSEWDVMKTHTTIGAGILMGSGLPLLDLAAEVALCHHERWNGQGYPRALKGPAIPLSGRIVALVDVFDALMSARPYKEPWPLSRALAHIVAEAGGHFDPNLVRLFMDQIQDFVAIRERDRDEEAMQGADQALDWEETTPAQVIPLPMH
ncbi:HD-GYP domain-containing protein [Nitrospirillum sp. BR 11163]|uniref:HD-GYP domain-containing protein n=1 Tax=Nitrospirillum sp. BR 11163 TaxID=3104323 RepID=UPI002B000938|nr:HD domain-containing phosphohydrolase [Nitrospirillum sp. BR 11163]MEA1674266.1 HD domain-containing protein [Nitrospirillum sp. BR 11163]